MEVEPEKDNSQYYRDQLEKNVKLGQEQAFSGQTLDPLAGQFLLLLSYMERETDKEIEVLKLLLEIGFSEDEAVDLVLQLRENIGKRKDGK